MRPQQQNRRMRGRNNNGGGNNNNNNRKGPNPLTRNYESNGPDVKIRGSAQQIAEKYATLARDAQSSGDRVMAENYLQHAEHYNRIIAAAQAQLPIQSAQQNRDDFDDDGDEDRDEFDNAGNSNVGETAAPVVNHGAGPQPVIDGTPAELTFNQENGRDNRDASGRDNSGRDNWRPPSRPSPQWRLRPERPARRIWCARRAGRTARRSEPAQRETGSERNARTGGSCVSDRACFCGRTRTAVRELFAGGSGCPGRDERSRRRKRRCPPPQASAPSARQWLIRWMAVTTMQAVTTQMQLRRKTPVASPPSSTSTTDRARPRHS